MAYDIYTATGCTRCQITKRFIKENAIGYEEFDIKAEGKEAFSEFYRANRSMIYRGQDGAKFPVFTDGDVSRQGVGAVIAHLIAETSLPDLLNRARCTASGSTDSISRAAIRKMVKGCSRCLPT